MMGKPILVALTFFLALVFPVAAQTGRETGTKWGKGQDSIDALRTYNLYRNNFKADNYSEALQLWRQVYRVAPMGHKYIIVDGPKMYADMIEKEQDPARKDALVDTLMMIYNDRVQFYPDDAPMVYGYMADAIRQYRVSDTRNKLDMLKYLDLYFQQAPEEVLPQDYSVYYTTLVELYKTGDKTAEDVLKGYYFINKRVDAKLIRKPGDDQWMKLKDYINQMMLSSGAATCDNLVKLFAPQFAANPDDVDLMKRIQAFLIRNNCLDENEEAVALFEKVSEALYEKEPSAQAAAAMAGLFIRNQNNEKAMEYLNHALNEEKEEENKADYYYLIAFIYANQESWIDAKRNIQEALKIRQWGDPYILLASIYASGGQNCGENDFEKRTIYWVIVDKLIQAKKIDPSVTEKVNEMISQYSRFFPGKEDAFFYGVNPGDEVTVGCWIGEKTRARF
ncbi:MAG: hypothetical protein PHS48_04435 [Bacteroidales bacterium]|nr:hypothetical protein [Bacteroidales bacterium]